MTSRTFRTGLIALCLLALALPPRVTAAPSDAGDPLVVAQAQGTRDGELEPKYKPRQPEDPDAYNNDYLFAMTRGVAAAAIHPAGKVPLYALTIPLDIAFLPFALIGGFFG